MAAPSAAAQLRASLTFKGPRPLLASWDVVALLRLDDPTLIALHQLLTQAHQRGADLALVPVPEGVASYQAALLAKVIAAPAPRARPDRRKAREPAPGEAEQKVEQLASEAQTASAAAERWLHDRLAQKPHRRGCVVSK